jgi:hypothetical protein
MSTTDTAKFSLGKVVGTPGALAAIDKTGEGVMAYIARHQRMEQGELDDEDYGANAQALVDGSRIFSAFKLKEGTKIWIITEAVGDDDKRESTCVLLPEDY